MRVPEESRIKTYKSKKKTWSITEGDYVRRKDRNDVTFQKIKSREKRTKLFLSIFFVLLGYGVLVVILSFISKF